MGLLTAVFRMNHKSADRLHSSATIFLLRRKCVMTMMPATTKPNSKEASARALRRPCSRSRTDCISSLMFNLTSLGTFPMENFEI